MTEERRFKCPHCNTEPIEPQDFDQSIVFDRLSEEEKKKYIVQVEQVEIAGVLYLQVRGVCPTCEQTFYGIFLLQDVGKEPIEE